MKTVAENGLIILFLALLVFHSLVLVKIIPYKIVWGGRLKTDAEMYRFEIISLLVNIIFLMLVLAMANWLPFHLPKIITTISPWVMGTLFLLNTVGNLLSKNKTEKLIFTPVTLLLTALCIILIIENG